jgi:L,D-transpeptidase catalytic domain
MRLARRACLAAAACLLVLAPGGEVARAADVAPASDVLSGPEGTSRWAFVARATWARSSPSRTARRVARVRTRTQDGTDELVLVLERTRHDGVSWVRVRLPVLPNGTTGWVPQRALAPLRRVSTALEVDLRRLRLTLLRRGRAVFRAPIGVGQRRWPTPKGHFYVRNRLAGYGLGSAYGPVAFGLSARSAVLTDWPGGGFVGIHGTNQPQLLPGRVSHGCIRLHNRDVMRLDRLMSVGTPVTVR